MKRMALAKSAFAVLLVSAFLLPIWGGGAWGRASAKSVVDLSGTDLNGATVLTDDNKYLKTNSYISALDNGFNVADSKPGYALSKNGKGTPFVSLFVDSLGEGGNILKGQDKYNGFDAYGFIAGSGEDHNYVAIKLKYNYPSNEGLIGTDGKMWNISSDSWKSDINGISGVGLVGKGAVIVQKYVPTDEKPAPRTSDDWKRLNQFSGKETEGIHTVDFFAQFPPSNHAEPIVLYTPDGDDLQQGIYVKITIAYELVHIENYVNEWGKNCERKTYKNVVEETAFYLCNTSAEIVFENLYEGVAVPDDDEAQNNTGEVEQKPGPITNNQGASVAFRLDVRGWNYDVSYRFNDSTNELSCVDGEIFTRTGKYEFIIRTKIGMVRTKTVYIHEKDNTRNIQAYFGDGLFSADSVRIFDPTEAYPVFAKGSVTLCTSDENRDIIKHAPLVGKIFLLEDDWWTVKRDENDIPTGTVVAEKQADDHNWRFSDLPSGQYEAIFFNNEEYFSGDASGDTCRFVWRFSVWEEGQTPYVNYELFYQQLGVSDYKPTHFVVPLPTKGTGKVLATFTDEGSAYDFACKYIVSLVDYDGTCYKLGGVHYDREADMLVALHSMARAMVEKRFFDVTDTSTYLSLYDNIVKPELDENSTEEDKAEYDAFVSIMNRKLDHDVFAFLSEESRINATVGDPFLNDRPHAYLDDNGVICFENNPLYFISIADFETKSISLHHEESGVSYDIPYGVAVQAFMESQNAPTGRYKIVEVNDFGTTEYYGVYIRRGDIQTRITIERVLNGNRTVHTLDKYDADIHLQANNFAVTDIENVLDPYGLIKIKKCGGETQIYQIKDVESIPVIDEEGNYEIELIDRLGNTTSFYVDIYTANKSYSFTLMDGERVVFSDIAYGGKKFDLPSLEAPEENLEFFGWEDVNGNIYTDRYVFNTPADVILKAVWHYINVDIEVYDGDLIADYSGKVGGVQLLPTLERDGYYLYGFRHQQKDGSVRFYRSQISHIPNLSSMRLDAVWVREEKQVLVPELESDETISAFLVDGVLCGSFELPKEGSVELPKLPDQGGMTFYGWLYEYQLRGVICSDTLSYDMLQSVGVPNGHPVRLIAVWMALPSDQAQKGFLDAPALLGSAQGGVQDSISSASTRPADHGWIVGMAVAIATAVILLLVSCHHKFGVISAIFFGSFFQKRRCQVDHTCVGEGEESRPNRVLAFLQNARRQLTFSINMGKFYRKVLIPCICVLLSLIMLYHSSYEMLVYAVEDITEVAVEVKAEKNADTAAEQRSQEVEVALESVEASLGKTEGEEFTNDEEFLLSNIIVDVLSMGYQDVFTAQALVGLDTPETEDDRVVEGIGYTAYVDAYEVDDGEYLFGAGFVSLAAPDCLTSEEIDRGVIIRVAEEEAADYEYTEFKLSDNATSTWGANHYVAFGNYVTYHVLDHVVQYTIYMDDGVYNDGLGDVYNYDINEVCHYVNYGESIDPDAYSISSDLDYEQLLLTFKETIELQTLNSVEITIEKANFISIQAINDYLAHNCQDETFLGVDADTLLYYEANAHESQYYIIFADGTVELMLLPDDPEEQATLWERIAIGAAAVGVAVVGVVCCVIPGVGPILGGMLISAAIDLFMQVSVSGVAPENIDWISVGTSAIVGGLTGGIGSGAQAIARHIAKTGVKKLLAQLGAEVVSGMLGGAVTCVVEAMIRGEKLDFEACLKSMALGAATGAIIFVGGQALSAVATKAGSNSLSKFTHSALGEIVGGAFAGLASYLTAIAMTGEEFSIAGLIMSVGMGAATATLVVIGGKIVKTVQSAYEKRINKDDVARLKNRINKHLPSDKNKNWTYETIDADGNYIKSSKASLLENPNQKMYIVNKDGIRIEIIDGYPQFSNVTSIKATIDDGIVLDRQTNFDSFDENLAKQWRNNPDSIPDDFKQFFQNENINIKRLQADDITLARNGKTGLGYTWHECEDMHTGYLVKTSIHKSVSHSGGIENLKYILGTADYEIQLNKQKMFNAIEILKGGG